MIPFTALMYFTQPIAGNPIPLLQCQTDNDNSKLSLQNSVERERDTRQKKAETKRREEKYTTNTPFFLNSHPTKFISLGPVFSASIGDPTHIIPHGGFIDPYYDG